MAPARRRDLAPDHCSAGRAGAPRPRSGPSTTSGPPPADAIATLGAAEPGRVVIDLAIVDARPSAEDGDAALAIAGRDGRPPRSLAEALGRLPAYALIGRRYVRVDGD